MKFMGTLIAVKDMKKAIAFYQEVLGLEVISDFGANATLTGGLSLQTLDTWVTFIKKTSGEIQFGNNACELYFEADDIEDLSAKLDKRNDVVYVHSMIEQPWGQRGIRFYDLDQHIIEVGENMVVVVKRFIDSGLSAEETAARMGVPVDYIKSCLGES